MSFQAAATESKNVVLRLDDFVRLNPPLAEYSGGLSLNFENRGNTATIVPFSWPSSAKKPRSSPIVVSPKRENWCVSSYIRYSWTDAQGRVILKGESPVDKEKLSLEADSKGKRFVLFKIPEKPGRYRFKLKFDNTIIDSMGKDFAEYIPDDYTTFRCDIEQAVDVE